MAAGLNHRGFTGEVPACESGAIHAEPQQNLDVVEHAALIGLRGSTSSVY